MTMRGAATAFLVTVLTKRVQLCTHVSGLSIAVLSTSKLFSSTCAKTGQHGVGMRMGTHTIYAHQQPPLLP